MGSFLFVFWFVFFLRKKCLSLALPQQITGAIFRVLHAKKSRDNLEGTGVLAPAAAWRGKHLICCYCKGGKHLAHRQFPSLWESPTGVDLNKLQQSIFFSFFFLKFPLLHRTCIVLQLLVKRNSLCKWIGHFTLRGGFVWKELCRGITIWTDFLHAGSVLQACCSQLVLSRRWISVQTLLRMRESEKE